MNDPRRGYGLIPVLMLALSVCVSHPVSAAEDRWPKVDVDNSGTGICRDALEMARTAYRSDNVYLYEVPVISPELDSMLVLRPKALDISEGDALIVNPSVFQKDPKSSIDSNAPRSLYWQVKTSQGMRFAMDENSYGWRGDQYALYALKDDVTVEKFMAGYDENQNQKTFTPLVEQGWRPPLVLQVKASGDLWAIDVGAPYTFLSDWRVFSLRKDGAKQACTIRFHPKAESERTLLPQPVRRLAALVDGTLGDGKDEGTFQQTARIRVEVMHTWANAAMRPWAVLTAKPYNEREVVDKGLETWSHQTKSFHRHYLKIVAQYPKAERSLARYYRSHFHKKPSEARAMAKQALDIAFRTYFVFPG